MMKYYATDTLQSHPHARNNFPGFPLTSPRFRDFLVRRRAKYNRTAINNPAKFCFVVFEVPFVGILYP